MFPLCLLSTITTRNCLRCLGVIFHSAERWVPSYFQTRKRCVRSPLSLSPSILNKSRTSLYLCRLLTQAFNLDPLNSTALFSDHPAWETNKQHWQSYIMFCILFDGPIIDGSIMGAKLLAWTLEWPFDFEVQAIMDSDKMPIQPIGIRNPKGPSVAFMLELLDLWLRNCGARTVNVCLQKKDMVKSSKFTMAVGPVWRVLCKGDATRLSRARWEFWIDRMTDLIERLEKEDDTKNTAAGVKDRMDKLCAKALRRG